MTLLVLVLNRQMRTVPNMFVASLAVSDLSTGMFSNLSSFYSGIVSKWPFGDATCRFQGLLLPITALTTVHTMALIAVNGYLRIVKPAKYSTDNFLPRRRPRQWLLRYGFTPRPLLYCSCLVVRKKWCTIPSRISAIFTSLEAAEHLQPSNWSLLRSSKLCNLFFLLQNLPESS